MMQLLISVKNLEEAKLAQKLCVDMIDLKDPNIGALGALNLQETALIMRQLKGCDIYRPTVSATIGEQHASLADLIAAIKQRVKIGVDIIKIAVDDYFYMADFYTEIRKLSQTGTKVVAVFFANNEINFDLLPKLQQAGFYGAMLDTQFKQHDLLSLQTKQALHFFTQICHQYQLKCGLAGSLKPLHIDALLKINPTYIGFRGGVCENSLRTSVLNQAKMLEVQDMLRNGNKKCTNPQSIYSLALHS